MTQCVILAGGRGSRVAHLLEEGQPKHLIPLLGVPFADYQLRWLADQGVTDVVYCLGYGGDAIREFVEAGPVKQFDSVVYDECPVEGTFTALRHALPLLADRFFVLYGDSYPRVDLRQLDTAAGWVGPAAPHPALMAVAVNDFWWLASNVTIGDGAATYSKQRRSGISPTHIDAGVAVLYRGTVAVGRPVVFDDLADFYAHLSSHGQLDVFKCKGFHEVGSPAGYDELSSYLKRIVAPQQL